MLQTFLIHYAEIGLKGKNIKVFEKQLIQNIKKQTKAESISIKQKQIILHVKSNLINQTIKDLQQVFGIAWFSPVKTTPSTLSNISKDALELIKDKKFLSFAIRANRINKNTSFTSLDIAIKVGDYLRIKTQSKVNLNNPDLTLYISVDKNKTYLYTQKIQGAGGLPVGSSGKVLSLLSGGFDSIVSSYLLSKRGAQVDFLHFHVFSDSKKVIDSKIFTIANKLKNATLSQNLFLSSYTPYQMAILGLGEVLVKQELVIFRRLMVKVGQVLAREHGYQALVLGDSLGQVASQTMENIVAVDKAVDIPIFRPLIGSDKKEIISKVKDLDLEKVTNLPYKDCCSIVSKRPATKADLKKIKSIEYQINLEKIVNEIIKQTEIIKL